MESGVFSPCSGFLILVIFFCFMMRKGEVPVD